MTLLILFSLGCMGLFCLLRRLRRRWALAFWDLFFLSAALMVSVLLAGLSLFILLLFGYGSTALLWIAAIYLAVWAALAFRGYRARVLLLLRAFTLNWGLCAIFMVLSRISAYYGYYSLVYDWERGLASGALSWEIWRIFHYAFAAPLAGVYELESGSVVLSCLPLFIALLGFAACRNLRENAKAVAVPAAAGAAVSGANPIGPKADEAVSG